MVNTEEGRNELKMLNDTYIVYIAKVEVVWQGDEKMASFEKGCSDKECWGEYPEWDSLISQEKMSECFCTNKFL